MSANSTNRTDVDAALEAGKALAGHQVVDLPGGAKILITADGRVNDLSSYMPAYKIETNNTLHDMGSLIAYVQRHKTDDTIIVADVESGKLVAVIDYHSAGNAPAEAKHRVTYAAPFSQEWQRWSGISGKMMPQVAFARFIEENREDIVSPDGADVLEIAKTLEANKGVNFKSGVRLDNHAVELVFEETIEAKAGRKGQLEIPQEIELGIPVFYGSTAYKVRAMLRYKIDDGALSMGIDLYRAKYIRDDAFNELVAAAQKECSVPVYRGAHW